MVHYYLKEKPADSVELKLVFLEANGQEIQTYSTKNKKQQRAFEKDESGHQSLCLEYALQRCQVL